MFTLLKSTRRKVFVASLVLFFVVFPLSSLVSFPQNDDWIYYKMVQDFTKGNFALDSISAPTFYVQGIIGALFACIFALEKLPILTLFVSVLCFYVLCLILIEHFGRKVAESVLISLLLFFNPLFVYSMFGFMTENYSLLFLLLAIYFVLKFEETNNWRELVFVDLTVTLGFFVRQVDLIVGISFLLWLIFEKHYKKALVQFLFCVSLGIYYYAFFPRTVEMLDKGLVFENILNTKYVVSLTYTFLIYLAAVLLPLVLFLKQKLSPKFLGVFLLCFVLLNGIFAPQTLSLGSAPHSQFKYGEFPYLENTWERKGFYPRGIAGTKYHFVGIYDLYHYWDIAARIIVSLGLASVFFYGKKAVNFFSVTAAVYLLLMMVTPKVYDRYVLFLVPVAVLFLVKLIPKFGFFFELVIFGFVLFLAFLSYNFAMDFVLTNGYVWEKSKGLVQMGVAPQQVLGANAWKLSYPNPIKDYVYIFSYDSCDVNADLRENFELVEEKEIKYPLSFWVNPRVFLYKKKAAVL